jgi:hypothetical protein
MLECKLLYSIDLRTARACKGPLIAADDIAQTDTFEHGIGCFEQVITAVVCSKSTVRWEVCSDQHGALRIIMTCFTDVYSQSGCSTAMGSKNIHTRQPNARNTIDISCVVLSNGVVSVSCHKKKNHTTSQNTSTKLLARCAALAFQKACHSM